MIICLIFIQLNLKFQYLNMNEWILFQGRISSKLFKSSLISQENSYSISSVNYGVQVESKILKMYIVLKYFIDCNLKVYKI